MSDPLADLFGAVKPARLTRVVPVLVPVPTPGPYSYAVPEDLHVEPGSVVQVPLGPRQVIGVVWDGEEQAGVDPKKLRPITAVFDCPPLDRPLRQFIDWVSAYTLSPPGYVARMALRAPAGFEPEPMIEGLRYTGGTPDRMTPARARVIETAEDGLSWTRSGLAHAAGVTSSVVDGLVKQGIFEPVFLPPKPLVATPDPDFTAPRLEGPQREAAETVLSHVREGVFSVALIDGVTGSGKTEVYFEAIAETLRRGQQVLILLPEIALTASFLERFEQRFGAKPAEWHSDLAPKTRERVWRQAVTGDIRVVAGARSALVGTPPGGNGLPPPLTPTPPGGNNMMSQAMMMRAARSRVRRMFVLVFVVLTLLVVFVRSRATVPISDADPDDARRCT